MRGALTTRMTVDTRLLVLISVLSSLTGLDACGRRTGTLVAAKQMLWIVKSSTWEKHGVSWLWIYDSQIAVYGNGRREQGLILLILACLCLFSSLWAFKLIRTSHTMASSPMLICNDVEHTAANLVHRKKAKDRLWANRVPAASRPGALDF